MYGGRGGAQVRLQNSEGMPTGALYVYASMLIRLKQDVAPERVVVVFDSSGPSFRKEIDPEYKANRSEMPDDLREQMPFFRPLTEAFSWPVISAPGFEADDIIATLVKEAKDKKWGATVYSADKDLMQLIGDGVSMVDAMRQRNFDRDAVLKKFGVGPELVRDWLALVGDTSDNIPGMTGVGPKTAAKLLLEHGDLDGVLRAADSMKGKMKERFSDPALLDQVRRSATLVTLVDDVKIDQSLDDLVCGAPRDEELKELFDKFEFHALWERMNGGGASAGNNKSKTDTEKNTKNVSKKSGAKTSKAVSGTGNSDASVELDAEVQVATSPKDIDEWIKKWADASVSVSTKDSSGSLEAALSESPRSRRIAVHLETTDARLSRQIPVSLTLAAADAPSLYCNFNHRYLGAPKPLDVEKCKGLQKLFVGKNILVCFDQKRLLRGLGRAGLKITAPIFDVMLAAYVTNPGASAKDLHGVCDAAQINGLPTYKEFLGTGKKASSFDDMGVEEAAGFAAKHARGALACVAFFESALKNTEQSGLFANLETDLARVLAQMEDRGVALDTDFLQKLSEQIGGELKKAEDEVFEFAGDRFNLGSPKQLSHVLFETMGLTSPRMRKTKTGYSTDHQVLDAMRDVHPVIAPILRHRELIKLKNTFIDALIPLVNPETGRLHTDYRQAVAATGRLSSVNPNLQNIPIRSDLGREIRRAFVAKPDTLILSADYSQIELRVLAHLCQDPVLVKAFANDIDVHTQTASEVFGIELSDVGASERRVAKAVNYGLVYGQSDFGLGQALEIPRSEAKHYIERYFERFSRVASFMKEVVEEARSKGFATTILGRRRPLPDLNAKNFQVRTGAERMAQNTPMQGSGADIMKLAILGVEKLIAKENLPASLILTVHDELVLEVETDQAEAVGKQIANVMENVVSLSVPLKVDVGTGPNWAEAH